MSCILRCHEPDSVFDDVVSRVAACRCAAVRWSHSAYRSITAWVPSRTNSCSARSGVKPLVRMSRRRSESVLLASGAVVDPIVVVVTGLAEFFEPLHAGDQRDAEGDRDDRTDMNGWVNSVRAGQTRS